MERFETEYDDSFELMVEQNRIYFKKFRRLLLLIIIISGISMLGIIVI